MIDPDMRNAIFQLHQEGMSLREISRRLHVSRNAVRTIVRQQGKITRKKRKDKIQIDPELLQRLYHECDGWIQRIHEKLVEEEQIEVGYSTLTRMLGKLGLGRDRPARCDRVPDEPGAEMQHDTTIYQVKLAGERTRVQSFRDEVFSARSLDVLGLRGSAMHHRQHESGSSARRGETSGDRPRNECLLPAIRLSVRLPCDRPSKSKSR